MRKVFKIIQGERGQLLPLAIILLSAGTLLVIALLPQISTMLQSGYKERELAMARYAAEAKLNRVVADMIRGADAYPVTYTTTSPHKAGQAYDTYNITTTYTAANVTVNDYTPSVTISLPSPSQTKPANQQSYVDPGVTHPYLATVPAGYAYVMRLYNVKAGTIQVNWAYSPASNSRIGVYAGIPTDSHGIPYVPGRIAEWPSQHPILDTGSSPANQNYNRTAAIAIDPATDGSGGVYTVVFGKMTGQDTLTTKAFQPSGGINDTWIYVKAYKDYLVTATAGGVSISTYLRQAPGYSEPPVWTSPWTVNNPSWITNKVYIYTWRPP